MGGPDWTNWGAGPFVFSTRASWQIAQAGHQHITQQSLHGSSASRWLARSFLRLPVKQHESQLPHIRKRQQLTKHESPSFSAFQPYWHGAHQQVQQHVPQSDMQSQRPVGHFARA